MTVNEIGKGAHFRDEEDEPQRATDTSVPKSTSSVPKPGTPPSAPVAPKYDALSMLRKVQRKRLLRDKLELRPQVHEGGE